jgi:HAD superfamily hydrolase (TIGR01549 family)
MIKTKAIVFDQGNTLVMDPFLHVMERKAKRFAELFEDHHRIINSQELVEEWAKSNSRVNYPYIGHFLQEELIIWDFLRHRGVAADKAVLLAPELLKEYRLGYMELMKSDPRTKEVKQTLETLKNKDKRLGIFSNDRQVALEAVLAHMDVKHYFEYVETSESIGIEKPDLRVYDHIVEHFGLPPDQITYVGDDPVRDIDTAKKAGLKAVLLKVSPTYSEPWRKYDVEMKYEPDATITELSELADLIV